MTEKQKQAIQVLLRLTAQKNITDEEHILLLDYIVGDPKPYDGRMEEGRVVITPCTTPQPLDPWYDSGKNYEPYGRFGQVTSSNIETTKKE